MNGSRGLWKPSQWLLSSSLLWCFSAVCLGWEASSTLGPARDALLQLSQLCVPCMQMEKLHCSCFHWVPQELSWPVAAIHLECMAEFSCHPLTCICSYFYVITLQKASGLETSSLQCWPRMWWLAWDNVAVNFIKLRSSCNHRFGNWFLLMISKSWTFQELWRVISIILALLFRSVLEAGVLVTEKSLYCRKCSLILKANGFIIFSTFFIDASDYYIISCNIN